MNVSRDIELKSADRRLILRPPGLEDASEIYRAVLVSKNELMQWMPWCHANYAVEETREWLRDLPLGWESGENYQFTIYDAYTAQVLGGCGLNRIEPDTLRANLGYWVRSDRTREGVATAAAVTVARFGFERLGLHSMVIVAAVENHASRRVALKTGAVFEKILERQLKHGEKEVDAALHVLLPENLK